MLHTMRTRRILAIALAAVMALSTPVMSFAETSSDGYEQGAVTESAVSSPSQDNAYPEIIETSSPSEDDGDETDTAASPSELILEAVAEDGMKVTLRAAADAFEYAEDLSLDVTVVPEEVAKEADKELESETKDDNIAKRVTYDIRVMYGDTEIEPLDGKKVKVEFTMSDIPSGADAVNVYHLDEKDGVETIVDEAPVNGGAVSDGAVRETVGGE